MSGSQNGRLHPRLPKCRTNANQDTESRPAQKKRRKNPFDLLVFVLLLAIAAIPIGHLIRAKNAPASEEVTLTLQLRALLPEIAQAVANTESVSIDGLFSLSVTHTERKAARLTLQNPDGTRTAYRSKKREDVTLTLHGSGIFSEDGFLLAGRRPLSAGMTLTLSATDLSLSAVLLQIERTTQKPSP